MSKTFKDYYQDPEFRKKHRTYMTTKVTCECGTISTRNNLQRHRKSNKHLRLIEEKKQADGFKKMYKEIKQIHKRIEYLEKR